MKVERRETVEIAVKWGAAGRLDLTEQQARELRDGLTEALGDVPSVEDYSYKLARASAALEAEEQTWAQVAFWLGLPGDASVEDIERACRAKGAEAHRQEEHGGIDDPAAEGVGSAPAAPEWHTGPLPEGPEEMGEWLMIGWSHQSSGLLHRWSEPHRDWTDGDYCVREAVISTPLRYRPATPAEIATWPEGVTDGD